MMNCSQWNEEASSLDSCEERVQCTCGAPRKRIVICADRKVLAQMDPETQPYTVIESAISVVQLTSGGGAHLVVSTRRATLETTPNPRSSADSPDRSWDSKGLRRESGENMRKWTCRFGGCLRNEHEQHCIRLMRPLMPTPFFIL